MTFSNLISSFTIHVRDLNITLSRVRLVNADAF